MTSNNDDEDGTTAHTAYVLRSGSPYSPAFILHMWDSLVPPTLSVKCFVLVSGCCIQQYVGSSIYCFASSNSLAKYKQWQFVVTIVCSPKVCVVVMMTHIHSCSIFCHTWDSLFHRVSSTLSATTLIYCELFVSKFYYKYSCCISNIYHQFN